MRPKTDSELFADTAGTDYYTARGDLAEWTQSGDVLNTAGVQLNKADFLPPVFAGLLCASFLHSKGHGPAVNGVNFYFPRNHPIHER